MFDPWALLQAGFWLSFAAVGLLMASASAHPSHGERAPIPPPGLRGWLLRLWQALRQGLHTQVVATLGLAPLTLVFFQQLSLVGFVANLVAIPAVTLVVTPLALLGTLWAPWWSLAAWVVDLLGALLGLLAAVPGALLVVGVAPAWASVLGLLAAVLLVMPLPWRLRLLALPLAVPLLWPPLVRPAEGNFELVAADVGQGTAVLVRTRSHLLVYDAGPQYSSETDAGQRVLLPLLRARGETRVDQSAAEPPRHRPRRRRARRAAGAAGGLNWSAPSRPRTPCRRMAPRTRRCESRPVVGLGRRALRAAAPAAFGL